MLRDGYPAYTTSAGWLGYPGRQDPRACAARRIAEGWTHFKIKVGARPRRRHPPLRDRARGDRPRAQADGRRQPGLGRRRRRSLTCEQLAPFDPWWIEEPTSPDDVLGHAAIARGHRRRSASRRASIARTASCSSSSCRREAIDFCQIDSCRLGGVNEVLAVLLMAAKFGVPVCPHAGGVGLCEYVQHLSIFDYIARQRHAWRAA